MKPRLWFRIRGVAARGAREQLRAELVPAGAELDREPRVAGEVRDLYASPISLRVWVSNISKFAETFLQNFQN